MYVEKPDIEAPLPMTAPLTVAILICAIGVVVMGAYPEPWVQAVMNAANGLF
jgi:NADH:ubiquinone oxidoreductase subunit 2 (subunit N)